MSEFLTSALVNLTAPATLFFALGVLAAWIRSDLEIPPGVGKALSLYLMISIGFKGGVSLAATEAWTLAMFGVAAVAVFLSFLMPWLAYVLLRGTTKVGALDAAAIAATYGSVSVVTFVTAVSFLARQEETSSGYLVAILALMETPAIVSGLVLAKRAAPDMGLRIKPLGLLRDAFASGSVIVLLGALAIGWVSGERGTEAIGPFFVTPFQGVLALFLLDMGLLVVRRLRETQSLTRSVIAFGLYMPLLGAALGLASSWALGLTVGDALLLSVLAASASYIAVPAALRHALPQADPGLYVTLALAITFPFNVILGIPLYYTLARLLLGG